MGIRFFCPNGHKLNVKEFLAGKRGICPFCGASVQIPTKSTRPSSHAKPEPQEQDMQLSGDPAAGVQPTGPEATQQPAAPGQASAEAAPPEMPSFPSVDAGPAQTLPPSPVAQSPSISPIPQEPQVPPDLTPPPLDAPPPVESGPPDPLLEMPQAVWYVRPESGGQFGPATADVMRSWLAEGRVVAGTLVWREGWPDWRTAADTFPQLTADDELAALSNIGKESGPAVGRASTSYRPPAGPQPAKARKGSKRNNLKLIVVLVLAVIALLVVFLYVVR